MSSFAEALWHQIKRAFNNLPLECIAKTFLAHHQVVNAIYASDGGDYYAQKSRGLHFGLRRILAPIYNGSSNSPVGVVIVNNDDAAEELDEARTSLKYENPDVSSLDPGAFLNVFQLHAIKSKFDNIRRNYGPFQTTFASAEVVAASNIALGRDVDGGNV